MFKAAQHTSVVLLLISRISSLFQSKHDIRAATVALKQFESLCVDFSLLSVRCGDVLSNLSSCKLENFMTWIPIFYLSQHV